jgi:hypothetical protein
LDNDPVNAGHAAHTVAASPARKTTWALSCESEVEYENPSLSVTDTHDWNNAIVATATPEPTSFVVGDNERAAFERVPLLGVVVIVFIVVPPWRSDVIRIIRSSLDPGYRGTPP